MSAHRLLKADACQIDLWRDSGGIDQPRRAHADDDERWRGASGRRGLSVAGVQREQGDPEAPATGSDYHPRHAGAGKARGGDGRRGCAAPYRFGTVGHGACAPTATVAGLTEQNDLTLARYTCIALQRLGGSAKKVKGSLSDKTMRLPMDNPIFVKLGEMIESAPRSPLW